MATSSAIPPSFTLNKYYDKESAAPLVIDQRRQIYTRYNISSKIYKKSFHHKKRDVWWQSLGTVTNVMLHDQHSIDLLAEKASG